MAQSLFHGQRIAERIHGSIPIDQATARLAPRSPRDDKLPPRLPGGNDFSTAGLTARQAFLQAEYGIDVR